MLSHVYPVASPTIDGEVGVAETVDVFFGVAEWLAFAEAEGRALFGSGAHPDMTTPSTATIETAETLFKTGRLREMF